MRHFWNRRQLDVEHELRAGRPRARAEFVEGLAHEIRSTPADRSRVGRIGLAFALSGLIVVLLSSFGGIGYAYSAAKHEVNKPAAVRHSQIPAKSAAQAQYGPFTPPKPKPKAPFTPPKAKPKPKTAPFTPPKAKPAKVEQPAATSSQLPFTGLALWVPIAIGLLLIAIGLTIRMRSHRRTST